MANDYRKLQQRRQDEYQFRIEPSDLVGTPHVFNSIGASASTATNFQMPANGYLAASHSVTIAQGDITIEAAGGLRVYTIEALAADVLSSKRFIWFEEGETIRITRNGSAIAGNFSLYMVDSLGRTEQIATCVFS